MKVTADINAGCVISGTDIVFDTLIPATPNIYINFSTSRVVTMPTIANSIGNYTDSLTYTATFKKITYN